MRWLDWATAALGIVAGIAGALLPAAAPFLLPAAGLLLGKSLPQPSSYLPRKPEPEKD